MKLSIILFIFLSLLSFSYENSKKQCEVQYTMCQNQCYMIKLAKALPQCLARCSGSYAKCLRNIK